LLRELLGCSVSPATLQRNVGACARQLVSTEVRIKRALGRAEVLHADETGLRVGKRGHFVHVVRTGKLTHLSCHEQRGKRAMDEIGILPAYRGICVHDGWWAYPLYTPCRHSLCCAHLLRELIYLGEASAEHEGWAEPLMQLLLEIKGVVAQVRASGAVQLERAVQDEYERRYGKIIEEGEQISSHNAAPDGTTLEMGHSKTAGDGRLQKQARNLLWRMQQRREEVLCFMSDFTVPFDNNQAGRDLRMVKLQQKVSGCLRTSVGARDFCRIRSYLSTIRKQGQSVLPAIEGACRGHPLPLTS
jgi:transposase